MTTTEVIRPPTSRLSVTPPAELVVLGSSGHAREVAWIAQTAGHAVLGCVGPRRPAEIARLSVPWLGEDDWLDSADTAVEYVIGIGSGSARARTDEVASRNGRQARSLFFPAAVTGARTSMGGGSVLWPGAIVTTDVRLGRHVHVGAGVTVGHDTELADYVTLLPGCTVAGGCRIGTGSTIGAGATVIDSISIGANSMVGAGAVVVRDVPENTVVVGVPARILRSAGPMPA